MPKLTIRKPVQVVLTFEGLATSSLGCYGCSWNETPTIDFLAGNGIVWDRCTTPFAGPGQLVRHWLSESRATLDRIQESGECLFVSDDPRLELPVDAYGFSSAVQIAHDPVRSIATSVEQTCLAGTFATAIDNIRPETELVWIHSASLRDVWDAPLAETEEVQEDDESDEDSTFRLPFTAQPPSHPLSDKDDPDLVFAWMNRYAAQVETIDASINWLLEALPERRPTLLLAGASGFALGENGWIGHQCGPLRSCHIRLPMLISGKGPLRVPRLQSATILPQVLSHATARQTTHRQTTHRQTIVSPSDWSSTDQEFDPLIETSCDRVAKAFTSSRWFYVVDRNDDDPESHRREQLFLKPDDVHDVNDVARLRPDVIDHFANESGTQDH